jgi:hypothetical protein
MAVPPGEFAKWVRVGGLQDGLQGLVPKFLLPGVIPQPIPRWRSPKRVPKLGSPKLKSRGGVPRDVFQGVHQGWSTGRIQQGIQPGSPSGFARRFPQVVAPCVPTRRFPEYRSRKGCPRGVFPMYPKRGCPRKSCKADPATSFPQEVSTSFPQTGGSSCVDPTIGFSHAWSTNGDSPIVVPLWVSQSGSEGERHAVSPVSCRPKEVLEGVYPKAGPVSSFPGVVRKGTDHLFYTLWGSLVDAHWRTPACTTPLEDTSVDPLERNDLMDTLCWNTPGRSPLGEHLWGRVVLCWCPGKRVA